MVIMLSEQEIKDIANFISFNKKNFENRLLTLDYHFENGEMLVIEILPSYKKVEIHHTISGISKEEYLELDSILVTNIYLLTEDSNINVDEDCIKSINRLIN